MKKAFIFSALFAVSTATFAAFTGDKPAYNSTDVSQAKDHSMVVLEGHIIEHVRHSTYIFQDANGKMNVNIDKKVWRGQEVSPQDRVKLTAKVDKKLTGTVLYVQSVQKIK